MADVKVRYLGDTSSLDAATARTTKSLDKLGKQTQQTQTKLTGAQKATQGAARSFSGLDVGAGIAAAGVGALALGLHTAISEAIESEKVTKQTEAVLRSTGGAAHVSSKQIEELANSISLKSGIDDEAIQSGENMLLTFTNIRNEVGKGNDIFNQATQVVTDLSVAMGQDMKKSAIQVGKALNDPVKGMTALTRVGVTFTQQQKDQVKALVATGDRLSAQKIILAELTKEFGGSAAAQATALDKMKVSVNNLFESIGKIVLPSFEDAATDVGFLADHLAKATDKSTGLGRALKFASPISVWAHLIRGAGDDTDAFAKKTEVLDKAIKKLADDTAAGANADVLAEDAKAVTAAQGTQVEVQARLNAAVGEATKTQDAKAKSDKAAAQRAKDMAKALSELGKVAGPSAVAVAKALQLPIDKINEETDAAKRLKDSFASSFAEAASVIDKFKDQTKVSFDEFARQQLESVAATAHWADNIAALAAAGIDAGFLQTLVDAGPAQAGLVQAILDNTANGSIETVNAIARAQTEAIAKTNQALADARTGVTAFANWIEGVNPTLHVGISAPGSVNFSPSAGRTGGANANFGLEGFNVDIGRVVTVRAAGGPVTKGMPYIVGEKRPELFVPNESGRIIPSVPNGGRPVYVQVIVDPITGQQIVRQLKNYNLTDGPAPIKIR